MRVWTELGATLSMRSGRNSLLKTFKHSVRREWYPTLVTLRTLPKGGLSHDADRDDFVEAWYELGMTVGLDEDKERMKEGTPNSEPGGGPPTVAPRQGSRQLPARSTP